MHHWIIDTITGLGECQKEGCPEKVRWFETGWKAPFADPPERIRVRYTREQAIEDYEGWGAK